MAVLILINILFSTITMLSNLVSRLIFNLTAYLLVLTIQALRVPGEALQAAMKQLGDLIIACIDYFLELAMEVISAIPGSIFDLVKLGVFGSVAAATGLAEKMRSVFDGSMEEILAVVEGGVEMVTTMVADLWNNYMDAQSYVTENA